MFAVGLFAAPQAVALFQGGHIWYDKDNIPCQKCHADVFAQLDGSAHHQDIGSAYGMTSYEGECRACHQVGDWEENAHMAVTPLCVSCHPHVHDELAKETESHKQFYKDTLEAGKANYACLGCHTHTDVNIKYTRPTKYGFSANAAQPAYDDCDGNAELGDICGVISGWSFGDFNTDVGKYDAEGATTMLVSGYSTQLLQGDFDPDDWFYAAAGGSSVNNNADDPAGSYLSPDYEDVEAGNLDQYDNNNPETAELDGTPVPGTQTGGVTGPAPGGNE